VSIEGILCVRAKGASTTVLLNSGMIFRMRRSIGRWEKQLPGTIFLRINRSTLVNINYVERIERKSKSSRVIRLKNLDETFPASERYFTKIRSRFLV
jgi:DNA-binding LytR/AlgR family response regulator